MEESKSAQSSDDEGYHGPVLTIVTPMQDYLDRTPDLPRNFGMNASWLAVPQVSPMQLATALELPCFEHVNWETGLPHALEGGHVFITSEVDGWTFAVTSCPFDYHWEQSESGIVGRNLLRDLSRKFGTALYFANDDDTRVHVWVRAKKGEIIRSYGFLQLYGPRMVCETGPLSATEVELGVERLFNRNDESDQSRVGMAFPTTAYVLAVAEDWSLNPTSLESRNLERGVGLLGTLPDSYRCWD